MSAREIDIHDRRNLTDLIRRAAYAETVYLGAAYTLTGNAQSIRDRF